MKRAILLMLLVAFAGCTDSSESQDEETPPVEPAETEPESETVTITGASMAPNPGSDSICAQQGIDGDLHTIGDLTDWTFAATSGYIVYFWNSGAYVSAGGNSGVVPADVNEAEVCNNQAVPGEYEVVFTPPS